MAHEKESLNVLLEGRIQRRYFVDLVNVGVSQQSDLARFENN